MRSRLRPTLDLEIDVGVAPTDHVREIVDFPLIAFLQRVMKANAGCHEPSLPADLIRDARTGNIAVNGQGFLPGDC